MPSQRSETLLGMQLPVYEGPQQQPQQQQHPQAPTTPRTATGGGALPPPSPKDVESELLRSHMQVLSTYVDRCLSTSHAFSASCSTPASLLVVIKISEQAET